MAYDICIQTKNKILKKQNLIINEILTPSLLVHCVENILELKIVSTGKILAIAMGKGAVINMAVSALITLTINVCKKEVCRNIEIWLKWLPNDKAALEVK